MESVMRTDRIEEAKAVAQIKEIGKQYGELLRSNKWNELEKIIEDMAKEVIEQIIADGSVGKNVSNKCERAMFLLEILQKPYLQIWRESITNKIDEVE